MRWVRTLVFPVGFALAIGMLFLPFISTQTRFDSLLRGGIGWTGLDLIVGGNVHDNLQVAQYYSDTTYTLEPTTVTEVYGPGFFESVRFMPGHAAGIIAAVLMLAGLLAQVLAGRKIQLMVASLASFGAAVAITVAESQALQHVPVTWSGFLAANAGQRSVPGIQSFEQIATPGYGFWLVLGLLLTLGTGSLLLGFFRPLDKSEGLRSLERQGV
jgi:hypothetical protein